MAGARLEAVIRRLAGDRFELKVEGERVDLRGMRGPVTLGLTIGDDSGTATVRAERD